MKWTQFTSARLLLASPVLAIAAGGVADKPLYRAPVCDGAADQVKGVHPDVVVSGGRAFLLYFTHPGRRGPDANQNGYEQKAKFHSDGGAPGKCQLARLRPR